MTDIRHIAGFAVTAPDPTRTFVRYVTASAVTMTYLPNGLWGDDITYKAAAGGTRAYLDITGGAFTRIPAARGGQLHTLFTLAPDGEISIREEVPQEGTWRLPIASQISQLVMLQGKKSQAQRDEIIDWMLNGRPVIPVPLDVSRVPAGYTLTNANMTATNTSGGGDYRQWVPAVKALIPATTGKIYWEVACQRGGAGTADGYVGVAPTAGIDGSEGYDSGVNPNGSGAIGYRGNGSIWSDVTEEVTDLATYGGGDTVMLAFEPSSGGLWTGVNGTWNDDPDTETATFTTPYTDAGGWLPYVHSRDPDDAGTLRSTGKQFAHEVPSTAVPYAEA